MKIKRPSLSQELSSSAGKGPFLVITLGIQGSTGHMKESYTLKRQINISRRE